MRRFASIPTAAGVCGVPTDDADLPPGFRPRSSVSESARSTIRQSPTPDPTACTNCRDLSVTFHMPMNFLFFSAPSINITRTKRVYLAT